MMVETIRPTTRARGSSAVPERPKRGRKRLIVLGLFLLVALALVGARWAAPQLVRRALIDALFAIDPDHAGSVGAVELSLREGKVRLRDLALWPEVSDRPTLDAPVVEAELDLSRSLRAKHLIVRALASRPTIFIREDEFVADPAEEPKPPPPSQPVTIDQVVVKDGTFVFRTRRSAVPVDLRLEHFDAVIDGIELDRATGEVLPKTIRARGLLMGTGKLDVRVLVRPSQEIEVEASLEELELSRLNETIVAAGGIAVEKGTLDVYLQALLTDRRYITARVRPFVRDLKPVAPARASSTRAALAGVADAARKLIEDERETIAADFEVEGLVTRPGASVLAVVGSVLGNAFLEELVRGTRPPGELVREQRERSTTR